MPFQSIDQTSLKIESPYYNSRYKPTFEQVTDARCQSLLSTKQDRHWDVMWSGGIDSTVLMVSLLKNLSPADRQNVTVYCNLASIYEYPLFYHRHIAPNFRVVESSYMDSLEKTDHYRIDGELGDQLFSHRYSKYLIRSDLGNKSWKTHKDDLIDFLTQHSDPTFAEWVYDGMKYNIESVATPIVNVTDWFWWLGFNCCWASVKLRNLLKFDSDCPADLYMERMISWFEDKDYQSWAFCNSKSGTNKSAARQYIYNWTRDPYYYKYKSKVDSGSRNKDKESRRFFCLLDDYSKLYVDTDLEEISELLPGYLKI